MSEISREAAEAGFFPSESAAGEFFGEYIGKVESLFKDSKIVEKEDFRSDTKMGILPFIVLDSSFTLTGGGRGRDFCHLSYEISRDSTTPVKHIYFLAEAGLTLLLKQAGERVQTDIGEGLAEYKVGSITLK
jgi:hypothetical protein